MNWLLRFNIWERDKMEFMWGCEAAYDIEGELYAKIQAINEEAMKRFPGVPLPIALAFYAEEKKEVPVHTHEGVSSPHLTELNQTPLGSRKNDGKTRYDLVPPRVLKALAEIYGKGAEKYEDHNWLRGMPHATSYACLMRHLQKWWAGEDIDPESDKPHSWHILWNAAAIVEMEHRLRDGTVPSEVENRPFKGNT